MVRVVTKDGEAERWHMCSRHHEVFLAEATRRNIPAIDKRVMRGG
jgi:hypothetical protein